MAEWVASYADKKDLLVQLHAVLQILLIGSTIRAGRAESNFCEECLWECVFIFPKVRLEIPLLFRDMAFFHYKSRSKSQTKVATLK